MSHSDPDDELSLPSAEGTTLEATTDQQTPPPHERVLSLGNVARMFGVSRLTLLYYEIRGLIWRRHTVGDSFAYGWADCERIAFIIKCRKAGIALRDIITIVDATELNASLTTFLRGQEKCTALVDRLERRRKVIGEALAELGHIRALLTTKVATQITSKRRR